MREKLLTALLACAWLSLPVMAQKRGNSAKGKEVFAQCGICHAADTTEKRTGPGFKGLFKREKLSTGQRVTDQNVLAIINRGKGQMPGFADVLSKAEKEDLLAYLKTL